MVVEKEEKEEEEVEVEVETKEYNYIQCTVYSLDQEVVVRIR